MRKLVFGRPLALAKSFTRSWFRVYFSGFSFGFSVRGSWVRGRELGFRLSI
jgi:hypothetical protein